MPSVRHKYEIDSADPKSSRGTTLARKAGLAFGFVGLVAGIGLGFVANTAHGSSSDLKTYAQRDQALRSSVAQLRTDWYAYDDQLNMATLVASAVPTQHKLLSDTLDQTAAANQSLSSDIANAQRLSASLPALHQDIAKVSEDVDGYRAFGNRVVADINSGKLSDAATVQTVGNAGASNALMAALDKVSTQADTQANKSMAKLQSAQHRMLEIALGAAILVIAMLGVLLAAFVRTVVRPVRVVADALSAVADGDLTQEIKVSSSDEIGQMGGALNTALTSIRRAVTEINEAASSVKASASELSAVSSDMSGSAQATSERAQAASAAAEQVSTSVQTVAAGAEEMGASISEIASNAGDAAAVASEAVTIARDTTSTVTRLGDSSAEVGAVIKAITSIAEQTNLLALNATIEAARAGEAGRGFAVVAGEVKELAQETARATEDIGQRVAAIQGDTAEAISAIEKISEVISRIDDYQSAIASAVEEQTATTSEMSRSVSAAAEGTSEIAANVVHVAEAAVAANDGVTHTRESTAELEATANKLRDAISVFRF
jgi:methyl-accepting chemotaxis protein